ncbi:cryptococcal mannosyltransferase 1-domain-containing protein [Pestalotiopsis sp. NC0098]|nr:cryptococcal mannosyltransferase 1-domain-containing protein [Pestalotiopsis sp. NC0098]
MRRSNLFALQLAGLFVVAFTVFAGYYTLFSTPSDHWQRLLFRPFRGAAPSSTGASNPGQADISKPSPDDFQPVTPEAQDLKLYSMAPYVAAIMDPADTVIPRLECPQTLTHSTRYEHLKAGSNDDKAGELKYFFALDLRNSFPVLPRLLGSVVEAIQFLGPSACALSVVESASDDATPDILQALRPELEELGLRKFFTYSSRISPETGDHTVQTAALRNLALAPLQTPSLKATPNTTVVFLDPVASCAEDILELAHQRAFQDADMTCAMDWVYVGADPTFRDVRGARSLRGETFFDVPADGSWDWAWNLFWKDPGARDRYTSRLPFQVYACWSGAVAFRAAPVLEMKEGKAPFRSSRYGECSSEETTLFCKDLWWAGYGKIAVVPSVNLEYSDDAAKRIKDSEGYTSKWTDKWGDDASKIGWVEEPPEKVKCTPDWGHQSWRPWNETLV